MIITRQALFSFRLQTGETIINFEQQPSSLELKIGQKRLSLGTAGEYEMEGIAIEGTQKESGIFYTIHWDDMIIGLGGMTTAIPYDMLLLLVTKPLEDAKALAPLCGDARILIPFGEEKMVASFLEELDENPEKMDKLTIKKKDIPAEGERKVVVLKPLKK